MKDPLPPLLPWRLKIIEAIERGVPHVTLYGPRSGKTLMAAHLKKRHEDRLQGLSADMIIIDEIDSSDKNVKKSP